MVGNMSQGWIQRVDFGWSPNSTVFHFGSVWLTFSSHRSSNCKSLPHIRGHQSSLLLCQHTYNLLVWPKTTKLWCVSCCWRQEEKMLADTFWDGWASFGNGSGPPVRVAVHNVLFRQFFPPHLREVGQVIKSYNWYTIQHILVPTRSVEGKSEKMRFLWVSN